MCSGHLQRLQAVHDMHHAVLRLTVCSCLQLLTAHAPAAWFTQDMERYQRALATQHGSSTLGQVRDEGEGAGVMSMCG